MSTGRAVETRTVTTDGAVITYDVHAGPEGDTPTRPSSAGAPTRPSSEVETPLLVVGAPMAAADFAALVGELTDRTVITYDQRGVERSAKDDPGSLNTPERHAADLQAVVDDLGLDQVDIFGSSGGAVTALAWLAGGGRLRTVVAHEPPLITVLPDAEVLTELWHDIGRTYATQGFGPAMARFIAMVMKPGPFTAEDLSAPAPDPATFGLPTTDDGTRTDPLLQQNSPVPLWRPDSAALQANPARLVLGIGEQSREILSGRAPAALARQLGLEPTWFPGHHTGFMPAEMGGDPAAFAARLREVLAG